MIPLHIAQTLDDAYRVKQTLNTRDKRHGNPQRKLVVKHVVGNLNEPVTFLVCSLEADEFEYLE